MAADGTPRITWHGKDFAATTEIVKLSAVELAVHVPDLPDPWVRRFIASLVAHERIEGANRIAPAHVLEMAACRFIQKGGTIESWHQYETELGVTKSKTRPPRSLIQPFIKWACGGRNDTDGSIGRLAAAFDAWLALGNGRRDPTPRNGEPGTSQLAEWLAEQRGYQEVAKAHNARLEYEAALKRGTVWVTYADGTERVYDTKAAGQSQNEGPAYEEPAEWWDLEGCEPLGPEYLRLDPDADDGIDGNDPLPCRIKGQEHSPHFPREFDYSKSKGDNQSPLPDPEDRDVQSESTTATGQHRQHAEQKIPSYADMAVENARLKARIAELEREVASLKAHQEGTEAVKRQSKQHWITPPPLYALLNRAFHFEFDTCPHDRPPDFNSLEMSWKASNYCNPPFSARLNPERHGPTDFVRKAIEENRLGKTTFIVVPTMNYVNMLLEAGAEPLSLGRVPWEDAQTGELHPTRPNITGFVLWGDRYTAADHLAIMAQLKAEIAKLNY